MGSMAATWAAAGWPSCARGESPAHAQCRGVVNSGRALPLAPLTLHAGAIADRFSKRRIIFLAQASMMTLAFVLAILCWMGVVRLWHVIGLAVLLGAVPAIRPPPPA